MSLDTPTQIAQALGDHLAAKAEANEFSQRFKVIVRHFPENSVPDLSKCKVVCRPMRNLQRYSAKRIVQHESQIDLTVQCQANPADELTWRPLRALVEELQHEIADVGKFGPGKLMEWENDPLFDFIQAKEIHVFKSTTVLTFRAHKEL